METDAAWYRTPYDEGKHKGNLKGMAEEMAAWADMLSRIGQKNSRLYEWIERDSILRKPAPTIRGEGTSGRSIMQELERERSRIARELHAGAGQPLAGMKLNLEMLDGFLGDLPAAGQLALGRLQVLTEQALQQVRAVSHNLHPPEWQGLKTEDALRRLVQQSGLAGRLAIDLDMQPLPEEPAQPVKVAIYRCAQECLSNVARHSGATRLAISLRPDGRMIELRMQDNGRGFPEGQLAGTGIGLTALREHAEALDGTCVISGAEVPGGGGGVIIVVRLPLDSD
jgi:two-component system NarL family sensor kinase